MRKIALMILMLPLLFASCDEVKEEKNSGWTVETVPNTRLQGNDIHVSDPDDFLSDSVEMEINTTLNAIRDKADVFIVALNSIGDAEPKPFATELLNYWGIGDAETNNGVLMLFVEDQHAFEIETGYGAESTLTDAKCEQIFEHTIKPFFREGNYERGLCAGAAEIVTLYGGELPMGLKATLPAVNNEEEGIGVNEEEGINMFEEYGIVFILFAVILMALPVLGLIFWAVKKKTTPVAADSYSSFEEGGATYIHGFTTAWSGSPWEGRGCLGGLMIGLSIFVILFIVIAVMNAVFPNTEDRNTSYYSWVSIITLLLYLTWICFRHNHRVLKKADELAKTSISPKSVYNAAYNHEANKLATWMAPWLGWIYHLIYKKRIKNSVDYQCPKCASEMNKDGRFLLPEIHALEDRLMAYKYTPYRCLNGHEIVTRESGSLYEKFRSCPQCGAFTQKLTGSKTIEEADYFKEGKKLETYVCQNCGNVFENTAIIPIKFRSTSSSSGGGYSSRSSSSSRSYHRSSSSHGSFGGGRSGGGGYSGRW